MCDCGAFGTGRSHRSTCAISRAEQARLDIWGWGTLAIVWACLLGAGIALWTLYQLQPLAWWGR